MSQEKLGLKAKIGYGFGDAASSMFWKLFSMYLMFFYTDIFGISAAVVGTMFLITRMWDAAFDPIVGIIADRTQTRWGKFRPYILWMCIPFGIIGILTFTTPSLSTNGKIIYAYITYSLMMLVYSLINVPYASLMGVMTSDLKDRTTLATFRFVFAFAGSILVLASFQPLFDMFGAQTKAQYNIEQKSITATDPISETKGNSIKIWDNSIKNTEKPIDSLLFLNAKIKTNSVDAFSLGIYNKQTGMYYWTNFPQGKDTLGLVRDGSWSSVSIKLSTLIPDTEKIVISDYSMAISTAPSSKVDCKKMMIKEIEYKSGTQKAVIVIAIMAILFFILTFLWTRERIKPINTQKQSNFKEDLLDLLKNVPWFVLLGAGISALIFNSIRDGAAIYYFKYYIQNQDAFDVSIMGNILTFTYTTLYLVLGQAANIIGVVLAKPISDKIGKSRTFLIAMLTASVLSICFFWLNRNTVILIFILQFFISIFAGIIFPLLWSMYADTADFSEWKTKRRATGLIFSSSSMSQKFGWTLGGAVTGWLLAAYGFEAGTVQTETAQNGIRMMLSIYPAIGALLSAVFILFYKLNDTFMQTVSKELEIQRNDNE